MYSAVKSSRSGTSTSASRSRYNRRDDQPPSWLAPMMATIATTIAQAIVSAQSSSSQSHSDARRSSYSRGRDVDVAVEVVAVAEVVEGATMQIISTLLRTAMIKTLNNPLPILSMNLIRNRMHAYALTSVRSPYISKGLRTHPRSCLPLP